MHTNGDVDRNALRDRALYSLTSRQSDEEGVCLKGHFHGIALYQVYVLFKVVVSKSQ